MLKLIDNRIYQILYIYIYEYKVFFIAQKNIEFWLMKQTSTDPTLNAHDIYFILPMDIY